MTIADSMTLAEIIDSRVRKILNDPETPTTPGENPTWATADLITWWNDFVRLLYKMRPEARLDDNGVEIPFSLATAKTDTAIVEAAWAISAGIDYLCYRAFSMEAGDGRDAERAQFHYDQFQSGIKL